MLNTLFSEWFNTVLPPLSELDMASQHLGQPPAERPDELLCTESEILKFLTAINISKASGPDNIPAWMLKSTAISIAPSITKIFNQSITTGTFPHAWKQSNVVPIPKSTKNGSPTNYRPISRTAYMQLIYISFRRMSANFTITVGLSAGKVNCHTCTRNYTHLVPCS